VRDKVSNVDVVKRTVLTKLEPKKMNTEMAWTCRKNEEMQNSKASCSLEPYQRDRKSAKKTLENLAKHHQKRFEGYRIDLGMDEADELAHSRSSWH